MQLLKELEGRVPDSIIGAARHDVGYGEYGLALENLCEQLFEFDARLTSSDVSSIDALAVAMNLPVERWQFTLELVATDESE